jgi:hypothetical protein
VQADDSTGGGTPGDSIEPRSSLDSGTKLDGLGRSYWRLTVYPEAGEAGGSVHSVGLLQQTARGGFVPGGDTASVARRRARGKLRRYCAANRLNRLAGLTYAGEGCWDQVQLRADVGRFFRRLRERVGRDLPYAWVPEWHPGGHGLHVHFVVGRYVHYRAIRGAWGHGIIDIRQLNNLPVGSGVRGEARLAARYLSKYLGKDFGPMAGSGLHRYEVAQGFQPRTQVVRAATWEECLDKASAIFGEAPIYLWQSDEVEDWAGPPALTARWR